VGGKTGAGPLVVPVATPLTTSPVGCPALGSEQLEAPTRVASTRPKPPSRDRRDELRRKAEKVFAMGKARTGVEGGKSRGTRQANSSSSQSDPFAWLVGPP
jgi:hypothetical protein